MKNYLSITLFLFLSIGIIIPSCSITKPISSKGSARALSIEERTYLDSLRINNLLSENEDLLDRKILFRNVREVINVGFENPRGTKIVANMLAARDGTMPYAKINDEETTTEITEQQKIRIENALLDYKVEKLQGAPILQSFKITISVK